MNLPEVIRIADATNRTVAQLLGSDVASRLMSSAPDGDGSKTMRQRVVGFHQLDAYLEDQAIGEDDDRSDVPG